LNWFRLDVTLPGNPKTLELLDLRGGDRALVAYIFSLCYCTEHGTDGFISKGAVHYIYGNARSSQLLVQVGFWEEREGGWEVHDYADYQPTKMTSKVRTDRARKAAEARWHNHPEQGA
jgi:hypothetical protein